MVGMRSYIPAILLYTCICGDLWKNMATVHVYTVHEQATVPIAYNLANANSLSLETNLCDGAEPRLVLETHALSAAWERI